MVTLLFESFFFNRIFIRFHLISFIKLIIYFNDYKNHYFKRFYIIDFFILCLFSVSFFCLTFITSTSSRSQNAYLLIRNVFTNLLHITIFHRLNLPLLSFLSGTSSSTIILSGFSFPPLGLMTIS